MKILKNDLLPSNKATQFYRILLGRVLATKEKPLALGTLNGFQTTSLHGTRNSSIFNFIFVHCYTQRKCTQKCTKLKNVHKKMVSVLVEGLKVVSRGLVMIKI